MEMNKGNFFSFKIRDRKHKEQGIFIADGEDWIFIRHLFTDYMIDGYMLLNKKYIQSVNRDEDDIFIENVLKVNNKLWISQDMDIPLSTNLLLDWFYENSSVFQIDSKNGRMCWVGKILDSTEKSIFLTHLTPKGIWKSSYYTFRKNSIRTISFDTDYINSITTYADNLK